jgi:predicted nuclease of predicted toxin-antitoxin system
VNALKLKLDANLGTRGRRLLVDAGHDVSTAEVQNLALASDETLIAVCAAEERALVTLDLDFANAMRYPPARYAGIVE